MPVSCVSLPFSGPRAHVWLRDLCGTDEQAVSGTDTTAALELLDRLLVARPGAAFQPGEAARMTTADRDQVLASLCSRTFGDKVEGTFTCEGCGARFDMAFELSALASAMRSDVAERPGDGVYRTADGTRFRLPTGEDELAVADFAPEQAERALLQRCLVGSDRTRERSGVISAMGNVGPALDLDLDAPCSECGHVHEVPFSAQTWLLGHIQRARPGLVRQIHRLASTYGWSLPDILALPRHERIALVALIDEERRGAVRPRLM